MNCESPFLNDCGIGDAFASLDPLENSSVKNRCLSRRGLHEAFNGDHLLACLDWAAFHQLLEWSILWRTILWPKWNTLGLWRIMVKICDLLLCLW